MRKGRVAAAVIVLGALALLLYARHESNRTLSAQEATAKGYIAVTLAYRPAAGAQPAVAPDTVAPDAIAQDAVVEGGVAADSSTAGPNLITVAFTRQAAAPNRSITVTLAAGTLVRGGEAGVQRLMIAQTVTVRLAPGTQTVSVTVPAYCLDAFLDPPARGAELALPVVRAGLFGPQTPPDAERDVGPLRKLVNCLSVTQDSFTQQPFATRQDAVWLVQEGLFDMTYAQAKDFLYRHWRDTLGDGAQRKFEDGKAGYRDALKRQNPGLTEEALAADLAEVTPDTVAAQVEQHAQEAAAANARDFLAAKPLLAGCGYAVDKLAFFQG